MKMRLLVVLLLGFFALPGCGKSGNQVVEPAPDPASMSLSPVPTDDIEAASNAMSDQMNPMSQ